MHRKKLKESGKGLKQKSKLACNLKLIALPKNKGPLLREQDRSTRPSKRGYVLSNKPSRRGSVLSKRPSRRGSDLKSKPRTSASGKRRSENCLKMRKDRD